MTWKDFVRKSIGVPFLQKGRDYDGWDCWGLVCVAYHDVLGIELPSYTDTYDSTKELRKLYNSFMSGKQEWRECKKIGSVALIKRMNLPIHVGILVDGNYIIHCEEKVRTIQEPCSYFRIEGYYEPAWI